MKRIEVGTVYRKDMIGCEDGTYLDVNETGITLEVYFDTPTESEIKDFKAGSNYKIGLFKRDGVLFFLTKFGNSNWMDAPYFIKLRKEATNPLVNITDSTSGYSLNVLLIDAKTGILKANRLIGLNNRFSKLLKQELDKQLESTINDRFEYNNVLNSIFQRYTTKNMVDNALMTYSSN